MKSILLIDKPRGITSFDVIRILREKIGVKKMGHAGTLDPLATGLMIVGVGEGTKELSKYLKLPKVYEAEIFFGVRTDTGDREGKIIEKIRVSTSDISEKDIGNAVQGLKGKILLPVPKYSAVKMGGEPLYKKARRGEEFKSPIKEMEILEVNYKGVCAEEEGVLVKLKIEVSSGTYIRSIAEELGRRLELPSTLWNLRRTSIGDFNVRDAERLSD